MTTAEILECIMLICFGFSWPISVVKNIKAKTAKYMSLPFNLLILFGYLAGVASKFIAGNLSYVLVVYFLNVTMLLVNITVYFINRRHDRLAEKKEEKTEMQTFAASGN